jgi:hypothetical protein
MKNLRSLTALLLFVCLVLVAASACAPPPSLYRRSVLSPSAMAGVGHQPLRDGQVDVAGSLSSNRVRTELPIVGDPAVHVAELNAVGHLRLGFGDHLTLGLQGQYAHQKFSRPSAHGTPPLRERDGYGLGPNASLHLGDSDSLSVTVGLATTYMNVPWAEWELDSPGAYDCDGCSERRPDYKFARAGRESHWLYRLQIGPNYQFTDQIGAFAGFSFQNSFTNIGFDNIEREGSTVSADHDFAVWYFGMTLRSDSGLYAQMQALWTIDDRRTASAAPGGQLTLGFQR